MYFNQLMENTVLWTAILGWAVAQVMKVILTLIIYKKLDFRRLTGSGGMPSSHSSFVVSLTASVGFVSGFNSIAFAVCVVMSFVVMYDAAGVRRSAGQQAEILNRIVEMWNKEDISVTEKRLKELLGHTPVEVIAGAILGIIIAMVCHM